jgi:hypothetical protein
LLDLQVIRPHPVVEVDGAVVCEIDGSPLFETADAAAAAVDEMVSDRRLVEEAIDDHDVLKHYPSGSALAEDFAPKKRKLPAEAVPVLESVTSECVVRERCRLRRLRIAVPQRRASAGSARLYTGSARSGLGPRQSQRSGLSPP